MRAAANAGVQWLGTLWLLALIGAAPVAAQGAAASDTTPRFLLPDLRPDALVYDGRSLWLRPVIGILADYTWFAQDSASRAQVGTQHAQPDLRAARFGIAARLKVRPRLELLAVLDFIEPRHREDKAYDVLDLTLGVPLGANGKVTVGKQKQPFSYEMYALAARLPQQERILSPFFVSRDVGVRFAAAIPRSRIAVWAGWFNDWFTRGATLPAAGNDYALRVTGHPLLSADHLRYLHLGVAGRYTEAENGTLRFRGRPESNVADYYIDTGDIPASHAVELAAELATTWRRVSLLAEWTRATLHGTGGPTPRFTGAYVLASWMPTGRAGPYTWESGSSRTPVAAGRLGALEVVGRYSWVDATDQGVDGGVLGKWYVGVNWWASLQWKIGAGFGVADLERGGRDGRTGIAIARLQWLY